MAAGHGRVYSNAIIPLCHSKRRKIFSENGYLLFWNFNNNFHPVLCHEDLDRVHRELQ